MKTRRIFLVGFMGSGKTTAGRHLAHRIGCRFVDLDQEIHRRAGQPIATIFAAEGESGFRRREKQALRDLPVDEPLVVATGGGLYVDEENIETIEADGVSIWLRCSIDRIRERVGKDRERPLVSAEEPLEDLLRRREPFYRRARITIDSDESTPEDLVTRMLAALERL